MKMTDNQLLRNIGGIKPELKELHILSIDETIRAQKTLNGVIRLYKATLLESKGDSLHGYVVTFNGEVHTFEHGKNAQRKFERLIDKHIFNR